ncbi:MAG: hypothetical protein JWP94_2285 [Mucilaginibacter sp.]|nr:hypothetical protein [Mucilaginibacter sp.]
MNILMSFRKKKIKYLIFSIFFLNGLFYKCLAQSVDKSDLIARADSFYFSKDYKNASFLYNLAFDVKNGKGGLSYGNVYHFYNAASANAHIKHLSNTFLYLNRIVIKDNLTDYNALSIDSNFSKVHKDKRWQPLLVSIIDNKNEVRNNYGKAVAWELNNIRLENIRRQNRIDSLIVVFGANSQVIREERILAKKPDSLNLLRLKSIINTYGWPGADIIAIEANKQMFNMILNSDFKTEKQFVAVLWQAFIKGNAAPADYAALADKVALIESKSQIYGSIVKRNGTSWYVPPIIDEHNVNTRRAKIGLTPLEDYLKQYGVTYSVPD